MGRLVTFKITESPRNRFPKSSALEASADSLTHISEEALDIQCHHTATDVRQNNSRFVWPLVLYTEKEKERVMLATSEGCHKADVQEANLALCGSRSRVDFEQIPGRQSLSFVITI